jgi:outer membrane protein OmpA-like peptidoglycan-associated protein
MKHKIIIFFLLAFPHLPVLLQGQSVVHLGLHGGYGGSFHNTAQDLRPAEGDCGQFTYGTGAGPMLGLVGEVQLLPWLRGTLRLSYADMGTVLTTVCDNGIIVPVGDGNDFAPLIREYSKDIGLRYGLLEVGVKFMPFHFPLFFSTGMSVGKPIFGATWAQDERILSPEGVLFPGFTARRSNGQGSYANTQLRSAVTGGIGYVVRPHARIELSPELLCSYPLNDAVTGGTWTISTITAGASLSWRIDIPAEMETPPMEAPPPPPPPPPTAPLAQIGTSTDAGISITETFVTETFPLLPYVFFEKNSDRLQDKYQGMTADETAHFSENMLPRRTMDIYYRLLDIMGKRLRDSPSIRMTLVGSTDDKSDERAASTLALDRAAAIKRYLGEVWDIAGDRMALATRNLPSIPSTQMLIEGDEENRRVEIVSDADELFRPIVHERLSEFDISPPTMELSLGAQSSSHIADWSLLLQHGQDIVAEFADRGSPPATLRWTLDDALAARVEESDTLTATLTITDEHGLGSVAATHIPVYKKQNSFEIGRLSLIVFDFDRSDILPHNQRMIRRFVSEAIKPSSSVVITGSTDRLGEARHNLELSTARANNVKAILLSRNPVYEHLETRGIGEAPHLYDNDLPEGRFYCRTVAVEVTTPME